ncbi:hypothetical protein GCM10010254_11000 [Streptomyces chromofuscus]|nr:hypothetical protein GCM10010254_11000 [Streptomyces chromofuscus]
MVAAIAGYPNRRSSAMLRTLGRGGRGALRFELGPFELGVSVALSPPRADAPLLLKITKP